jgi:hypothetical protein
VRSADAVAVKRRANQTFALVKLLVRDSNELSTFAFQLIFVNAPGLLTWRLADGVCLGLGLGSGLDLLPVFSAFSGVSRGPGGAGF